MPSNISGTKSTLAAALVGAASFCCLQMYFLILAYFRLRSGLYFWSLVGGNTCQLFIILSVILYLWVIDYTKPAIPLVFGTAGYTFYPMFEFLVLYSRLHLLQASKLVLNAILAIIVVVTLAAEVPMAVLWAIKAMAPPSKMNFSVILAIWRTQSVIYFAVEAIVSATYFFYVQRMWSGVGENRAVRRMLQRVLMMTVVMIACALAYVILTFSPPFGRLGNAIGVSHFLT